MDALAAMDALDAAVRASLAAVRASVKDAGAHERAAVVARLASLASTMRLDDRSSAEASAPRAEVHVQTDGDDGAAVRRSSFGADGATTRVIRRHLMRCPRCPRGWQTRTKCPRRWNAR